AGRLAPPPNHMPARSPTPLALTRAHALLLPNPALTPCRAVPSPPKGDESIVQSGSKPQKCRRHVVRRRPTRFGSTRHAVRRGSERPNPLRTTFAKAPRSLGSTRHDAQERSKRFGTTPHERRGATNRFDPRRTTCRRLEN